NHLRPHRRGGHLHGPGKLSGAARVLGDRHRGRDLRHLRAGVPSRHLRRAVPRAQEATMRLEGKVAIVAGAASGLGRAIAERFLKEGARVAIADVKGAEQAAEALGAKAMGVSMDVTNEKQVDEGIAQVAAKFSAVDVLVSNAGV